jgi:hypothetical protein
VLIPAGLLWILITAAAIELPQYWRGTRFAGLRSAVVIVAGVAIVFLLLYPLLVGPPRGAETRQPEEAAR